MSEDGRAANSLIPRTRSEAIVADLRQRILAGDYRPGERLRQSAIADTYGVSTTPVREAFSVLAREGLVRKDAHRGVEVFMPSVDELQEIYELRLALEPLAAELAAKNLTAEQLDELQRLVKKMKGVAIADYPPLNREFHRRVYEGSGRNRLIDIISTLRESSSTYTNMTVRLYDAKYHRQVQKEHEAILAALRKRQKRQVGSLIRKHLENNRRHQSELLNANPA